MTTASAMFEKASRQKLRFDSNKGSITTEDLWDLPLTVNGTLDQIAASLEAALENKPKTSFIKPATQSSTAANTAQLKFDIVKYVIETRTAERDAAQLTASRSEEKQKILGLIARKKEGELGEMSIADLQKMADAL